MTPFVLIRLLCATMLFLLAGCAHRLQFRVVDAGSGSGLADVKVKLQERRFSYFYRHLHEHAVGATDTNGMVTVDRVSSSDVLYFDAPSHRGTAAGLVGRGRVAFGPFPPVDVDTMWRDRREVSSDGIIVIPLLPK